METKNAKFVVFVIRQIVVVMEEIVSAVGLAIVNAICIMVDAICVITDVFENYRKYEENCVMSVFEKLRFRDFGCQRNISLL